MKILGRLAVFPAMPDSISRLHELAFNLWWSWNPAAVDLYRRIDPELWDKLTHNPVRFLVQVNEQRLHECAADQSYLDHYQAVMVSFNAYMGATDAWFSRTHPSMAFAPGKASESSGLTAYFSAEFGLHECLPIYSGGLGVLAGDNCKEASDLGLPFVGVGFLYPQGYFIQTINRDGAQEAQYEKLIFSQVPATPALTPTGEEVLISVDLPGRRVYAKVWKIQVGRIPLYLMDTDVPGNAPGDRELSARLYGGDHEIRIAQEIVLGIGGVRALRALGLHPAVFHMNEGHSAFLNLERARELVSQEGLSFAQAREVVAGSTLFTTHTPVPAGNDVFDFGMIDHYFHEYWGQLGLDQGQFYDLGRQDTEWGQKYGMTVLALHMSSHHNGVSALHGAVAREMWHRLWPNLGIEEVPIGHVTNGVHTGTWLAPAMAGLYSTYLSDDWADNLDDPDTWSRMADIPDDLLWATHNHLRHDLLAFLRGRLQRQRLRLGEGTKQVQAVESLLNPHAFTIGFARRSATYKRATLLLHDLDRLRRLLNNPDRPVQILFAGKAHPADEPGKEMIGQLYRLSRQPDFEGKIVYVEGYDLEMARYLVSGADIWLNNPIRPYEASGTSGQKAALNGLPNCSILDGWWDEGYNGKNGWAIGEPRAYANRDIQDEADCQSLYSLLEDQIVPLFFDREADGVPHHWIAVMKEAIRSCAPQFSMRRQVKDYTQKYYMPAAHNGALLNADNFCAARQLAEWKAHITANWSQVWISADGPREGRMDAAGSLDIVATVHLGTLSPEDVSVEVVYGWGDNGVVHNPIILMMQPQGARDDNRIYTCRVTTKGHGSLAYGVRVIPHHADLPEKHDLGQVAWA